MAFHVVRVADDQFLEIHKTMIDLAEAVQNINKTLEDYFSTANVALDKALQEGEEPDGAP